MRAKPRRAPSRKWQSAARKASRTCRWAKTMTAWLISFRRSQGTRWHIVDFVGANGCESRGVVDLMAVRKDHCATNGVTKRGDLLDIVLIQVKGGSALPPTQEDISRLKRVAKYHRAKAVVLSEWKRQKKFQLYLLQRGHWVPIEPHEVF
jgi:hypothetical protein